MSGLLVDIRNKPEDFQYVGAGSNEASFRFIEKKATDGVLNPRRLMGLFANGKHTIHLKTRRRRGPITKLIKYT